MNEDLYSGGRCAAPNDESKDRLCAAVARLCDEVSKLRRPPVPFGDVEEIMNGMDRGDYRIDCDFCRDAVKTPEAFSVMTSRGQQVSATFNFCPVCGRKL